MVPISTADVVRRIVLIRSWGQPGFVCPPHRLHCGQGSNTIGAIYSMGSTGQGLFCLRVLSCAASRRADTQRSSTDTLQGRPGWLIEHYRLALGPLLTKVIIIIFWVVKFCLCCICCLIVTMTRKNPNLKQFINSDCRPRSGGQSEFFFA
jgi:hypothetical protein